MQGALKVAVVIPCYNEEVSLPAVVRDFRRALPNARLCVFDNASSDRTAAVAMEHGAEVFRVDLRGKGNVVRRMFADVEADVYLMVDGDATYHAESASLLIDKLLSDHLDMVVGCRVGDERAAYRSGHRFGNMILTGCVSRIFGGGCTDMLSGYRAFSRRYAKSFPAASAGFETETELTVHALELKMPYGEVSTPYVSRPEGSESKLSTYRDGFRILMTIIRLYKIERPARFFGLITLLLWMLAVGLSVPLLVTYAETGLVPRFPTAILTMGLVGLGFSSLICGLILDTVTKGRQEMKHLVYLSIPATSDRD
jgi:glycosyltransferase involved in cell wall biosynthesis